MPIRSNNPILDRHFYEQAARDYCASLPLEHFMESTAQQTQRKITVASFELVHARRPDVWMYNELLVQYPQSAAIRDLGRAVPDNLVVVHDRPINGTGSFNTPFEQAELFLAMEYVSDRSKKKDFVDNMDRYEFLKIRYYMLFDPETKELLLFKRSRAKKQYVAERPTAAERYRIPELELELGLYEEWVRFWFRGELLPLPAELDEHLQHAREKLRETERKLRGAEAEIARLKAELARLQRPDP